MDSKDNPDMKERFEVQGGETNELNEFSNKRSRIKLIILIVIILLVIALIILLICLLKGGSTDTNDNADNKGSEAIEEKIPAIFDVDEGGDDMIAYMLANISQKFDILGITTVTPDHIVDDVTNIWLRFLEYMNFDAKIYKGQDHPSLEKQSPNHFITIINLNFL